MVEYETIYENYTEGISIIYFAYGHSRLEITVIPEFPLTTLLLASLMLLTTLIIFTKKNSTRKQQNHSFLLLKSKSIRKLKTRNP